MIDFWATWSGPCETISPLFEKFSEEPVNSSIGFYKVDVDDQPAIAEQVGIRATPTFCALRDGNKIETVVGANPPNVEGLIVKARAF